MGFRVDENPLTEPGNINNSCWVKVISGGAKLASSLVCRRRINSGYNCSDDCDSRIGFESADGSLITLSM